MKTRTKKIFAWVMTLAMLLSLVPATGLTVSAAATTKETKEVTFDFTDALARPDIINNKIDKTAYGITLCVSDNYLNYSDGSYLYMLGDNSSLKISCASGIKIICVEFYLYNDDGYYRGFQHATEDDNDYAGVALNWNNSDLEWYGSEEGFTSLSLSCGSSVCCPRINRIVVTYQDTSTKTPQTLNFNGDIAKTYGDTAFTEAVTGAETTVSYASSDKSVATVDSNGEVTILKAGSTTITATAEETDTYATGKASYELTVAPKTVQVTADNKNSLVGEDLLSLTYTISSATPLVGEDTLTGALATNADKDVAGECAITQGTLTDANNPNYTITFTPGTYTVTAKTAQTLSFNGDIAKTYGDTAFTEAVTGAETTVTYASDTPAVATVDSESGEVTILKAGTATITATAEETDTYAKGEESYKLTVAPKTVQVTADNKNSLVGEDLLSLTYTISPATPLVGEDTLTGALATEADKDVAGEYAITQGTLTDANNPNYTITFTPGTYTVTEKPSCSRVVYKDLKAGEQILALDGVAVGTYTLAGSGDGWTVQNADGMYLTFNETDKTVSWTETPTVWSYNGGLYVPVQETQCWHWWWEFVGESDYYLALDEGRLVTTLAYTFATVQETEVLDAHDYIYINNQDGTHDALCLNCGEKIEGEAHTYVDGKCICGAFDPTDLTVNVTVTPVQKKILWRTRTTYKAEIETSVPDVSIQSRTTEDGAWNYGPVYTSSRPIDTLYVQVTDSNGAVTNWKYADGVTTKAE